MQFHITAFNLHSNPYQLHAPSCMLTRTHTVTNLSFCPHYFFFESPSEVSFLLILTWSFIFEVFSLRIIYICTEQFTGSYKYAYKQWGALCFTHHLQEPAAVLQQKADVLAALPESLCHGAGWMLHTQTISKQAAAAVCQMLLVHTDVNCRRQIYHTHFHIRLPCTHEAIKFQHPLPVR